MGLLVPDGPVFIAARLVGAAAAALTIPAALATVALSYRGVARATAIGIAYAAYAGANAVMPILLTVIPGSQWPGFVVAPIAAIVALFVVRGRIPDLERPGHHERPYVLGTALWASAIVAISSGVLWLGSGLDNPIRLAIIGFGVALLVVFRSGERPTSRGVPGVDCRSTAVRYGRAVRGRRDRARPVGADGHAADSISRSSRASARCSGWSPRAADRRAAGGGTGGRATCCPGRAADARRRRPGGVGSATSGSRCSRARRPGTRCISCRSS